MKQKIISLLSTVIFLSMILKAQNINEPYEFPIRPGTPEWKELKSGDERAKACTVPQEILDSLTTEALVKTSLQHPLLFEITLHDNYQDGFSRLLPFANCLEEMLNRKESTNFLLEAYQNQHIINVGETRDVTLDDIYLEVMLSHDSLLNHLDMERRQDLKVEAYKKVSAKIQNSTIYGRISVNTSALILAKILILEGHKPELLASADLEELDLFTSTGFYCSDELLQKILELSQS